MKNNQLQQFLSRHPGDLDVIIELDPEDRDRSHTIQERDFTVGMAVTGEILIHNDPEFPGAGAPETPKQRVSGMLDGMRKMLGGFRKKAVLQDAGMLEWVRENPEQGRGPFGRQMDDTECAIRHMQDVEAALQRLEDVL